MSAAKALAIIGLSVLLAVPSVAVAQGNRVLRVAVLDEATEKARAHSWQVFRERLRELGYIEGKNLVIEVRFAGSNPDRVAALVSEVVAAKPNLIVASSTPAARALIQATSTIPIVFTGIADPIASGLVTSLARPGGNATGLSNFTGEVSKKWIELLREIAPQAKRVAYLADPANTGSVLVFNRLRDYARPLGLTVVLVDGRPVELDRSPDALARGGFDALIVGATATVLPNRDRIVQLAANQKLPAIYARREYVEAGGLLSYGVDMAYMYRRTAEYVDRIAKGAKPADMPVEQPSAVRMVLNLKTSRALGIAIPDSIRHRADELIN